jgi:hypothetical protein
MHETIIIKVIIMSKETNIKYRETLLMGVSSIDMTPTPAKFQIIILALLSEGI